MYLKKIEVLSSDEDEIDDAGQDYLEALDRKIKSAQVKSPFDIKTEIVDVSQTFIKAFLLYY